MAEIDFIAAFYNEKQGRETLIQRLDSLNSYYLPCRAIPFSSERKPREYFVKSLSSNKIVKLIYDHNGIQLYEMSFSIFLKKELVKVKGKFFIYEHPEYENVYVAITIENNDFFTKGILSLIQNLYPTTSFTFITHDCLKSLIDEFKIINHLNHIKLTRASLRIRFEEKGKNEKIMPMIGWPNMDINDAFDWVYQNNGWFQNIQLEIIDDLQVFANISITRQGAIQTRRFFLKSFHSFVEPVCKIIHNNIAMFSKRSRRELPNQIVRPLSIDFGSGQFENVEENKKFIQCMKLLKSSSISVIHGNPYVHLSIIDYYDGSTFDLWITDSQKVYIVPQMKGTMNAIKRIINHIFDTYAEGTIKDYSISS